MNRENICAVVAFIAIVDVIGLVGSLDCGTMTIVECIPRAIAALIVAAVAMIIGESAPGEKKNAAPDGNQERGDTQKS